MGRLPARPWFPTSRVAVVVGVVAFVVGWAAFSDAYEARGRKAPAVLRPFTWW